MRCGFYETEITPPLGSAIPGYYSKRWSNGVKDKLYAKAAVLENAGTYIAFLAIDSLAVPKGLPEVVKKRVCEQTEIREDAILIAAIHSHTALPVVPDAAPESDVKRDQAILDMTALLAADTVILAYRRLQPVSVRFGIGRVEGVSFVREYYLKDGTIRTNPDYCRNDVVKPYSEPDYDLPVFFFADEDGRPIGAITSFALHHDTVHGTEYSSDYSGLVAKKLKNTFGSQFITVFYQGFCGNINHVNFCSNEPTNSTEKISGIITRGLLDTVASAQLLTNHDLAVKKAMVRVDKRKLEPGFLDSVKALVENPPEPGIMTIADPYSDQMKYASAPNVLKTYDKDKRTELDVPVQVIKIGDCLIYAFAGEIFSQFGDKIRANSPSNKNMLVSVAHSNEFRMYVPIPELFLPYVYESTVYSAKLEPDAGDKMVCKVLELAEEMCATRLK